jgi:hypothetical protein
MRFVGIIDSLSVRQRPGTQDEYDLLAGEKRYRSTERAGLDRVSVLIFKIDNCTAEDIKLISKLQRSDLNVWEETQAIMNMLMRHLQRSQDEIISLLNQVGNQKRGLTSRIQNSGYQDIHHYYAQSYVLKKNPQQGELSELEWEYNQALGREWVCVEHVNRRLKVFKILGQRYRNRRQRYGLRCNLMAALDNFELAAAA